MTLAIEHKFWVKRVSRYSIKNIRRTLSLKEDRKCERKRKIKRNVMRCFHL